MQTIHDEASLLKEINERKSIIQDYRQTGFLNRERAVKKILELRSKDAAVAEITTARLAVGSVPFSQATDQGIIEELQMQVGILTSKLLLN